MISKKDLNVLQGGLEKEKSDLSAIDLLKVDHDRQLGICKVLQETASSIVEEANPALIMSMMCFMKEEFPRHTRDEEEGLLPLLQSRCKNDPVAIDILHQLRSEHACDTALAAEISEGLAVLSKGEKLENPTCLVLKLTFFAEAHRRHIEWENMILLPLARTKLMPEDMRQLQKQFVSSRWSGS